MLNMHRMGQRPVRKHLVHFGAHTERESVRLQDLCYVQYKQKERVERDRREKRERIVHVERKVKRNQAKREKRGRRMERRLLHFIRRRGEEKRKSESEVFDSLSLSVTSAV